MTEPQLSSEKQKVQTSKGWRIFRWLKRGLYFFLILVLLLAVFHRPLLHYSTDWAVRHFLTKAGYTIDFRLEGNVLSNTDVHDLRLIGPKDSALKKLDVRHFTANYSLKKLLPKNTAELLNDITVSDADIEIDPHVSVPLPPKLGVISSGLPDYWAKHIDLHNVNVRIAGDAGDIVLRGLDLTLDESKPGEITIGELIVPSANLHLTQVHGKTTVSGRKIVITELTLMQDVHIDRLAIDMQDFKNGGISIELTARSGDAFADASLAVKNFTNDVFVDLTLALKNLDQSQVARWVTLPDNVSWRVEQAAAHFKGSPGKPQTVDANISLDVADLNTPALKCETLQLRAKTEQGMLKIDSLTFHAGENILEASAEATLPETWDKFSLLTGEAKYRIDAPALETLAGSAMNLAGKLRGSGSVKMNEGALAFADVSLEGSDLNLFHVPVASLDAKITTDAKAVRINSLAVRLDNQNSAEITGEISLGKEQRARLEWNLQFADLAMAMRAFGLKDLPLPEEGSLASEARAEFVLADWRTPDFLHIHADGTASVQGLDWQKARLESASLTFSAKDGIIDVTDLEVRLNDRNRLKTSGRLVLDNNKSFTGDVTASFQKLEDFSDWLELAKMPRITAGSAELKWKGEGKLSSHEVNGEGALQMAGLKLEGNPLSYSLDLVARHDAHSSEISRLTATAGKFRADATASISETLLNIPRLTLFSEKKPLAVASVNVPLTYGGQSRAEMPIDSTRPVQIDLQTEKLDLSELFMLAGQKSPVSGDARAELHVQGALPDLTGKISVSLSNIQMNAINVKLRPAAFQLDGTLVKKHIALNAIATQAPFKPMTAKGDMPFDVEKIMSNPRALADAPLTAEIAWPDSDLHEVQKFLPGVTDLKGTVGLDVKINGPLHAPKWNGTIHAYAPSARLTQSQTDLREMKARITFVGQKINVEDVSAVLAGGKLKLHGTVDATQLKNPAINLQLDATEALVVRDDTMSLRADGTIICKGNMESSDVSGRVELVRGRVFKEIEFLPLSLPNGLPPPPPPQNVAKSFSLPAPFAKWKFNVDIITRDSIRLLGNVLNGSAVANLHMRGTGAKPEIDGKISLENSRVRLPNSRLNITRGDIIFNKDRPLDPVLDVQGDSQIGGYFVTIYATDRAVDPKLRFTSSPPLSEGEIATLLATGSSSADLRTAGGAAANTAAFQIFSKFYRNLFDKGAPKRYDDEPPKFSLSFSPLSSGSSRSNNVATQPNVSAIYEFSPHYQFKGTFGENGIRGMLHYLVRFR